MVCRHWSAVIKRNILEILRDLLRGNLAEGLIQRTVQNEADGSVLGAVMREKENGPAEVRIKQSRMGDKHRPRKIFRRHCFPSHNFILFSLATVSASRAFQSLLSALATLFRRASLMEENPMDISRSNSL